MDYDKIGRIFFPVHCPICDRAQPEGQRICPECVGIPRIVQPPRCLKCSKHINIPGEIYCYDCLRNPGEYDRGFSLFEYQSIHDSISAFKNLGRPEYGEYYGRILGEHYREEIRKIKPDALLPIPLHEKKYWRAKSERSREFRWSMIFYFVRMLRKYKRNWGGLNAEII